ncbi:MULTISPECIES: AAA family ATPase [unclassified Wenzhouxiangella]|uniref:AAA family ATPase n=1 Tax=unclassified Wenzhouxiangella TaxID=2613841 RepID=UPI000E32B383|nr:MULTISPECIES: AAA family ATPase [unclassified Wenzhouxiangella]RFF26718.1 hypothetical protein DZK25_11685 [Wenzhouxiangella sp. 15181]RFP69312.1 hypothetical protein DZK26_04360 [Wenzhouxiangella sp. 15190]
MTDRGDKAAASCKVSELPFERLGEALERERAQQFVGREPELGLFDRMLAASPPFRVLLLHGPGGIGKSTLLDAMRRQARSRGLAVVQLDGRDLPGDRHSLERAFRGAIESASITPGDPAALLVDNFESLATVERWFRETLLADLPGRFRVVLAMRQQPETQWQLDAGWSRLARVHRLEDLAPDTADFLLDRLGVPVDARPGIRELVGGHPLALTLAGQLQRDDPQGDLSLIDSPQLVSELAERHLADAPSSDARRALYACALSRRLTRPLLAAMLAREDVDELFDWLRRQSFVRETVPGLVAHDLVADALCARLEHRDPESHRRLIRRGMRYLLAGVDEHGEAAITEVLYLMRGLPAIRRTFVVGRDTGWHTDRLREGDADILAGLVEGEWGPHARQWFETWVVEAPEWLAVLRDRMGRPLGMSFFLDAEAIDRELAAADPAVRAFRDHVRQHAPIRRGERAMLARFLLARADGESLPAGIAQLQCHNAFMPVSVKGLAISGSVRPDNEVNRTQAHYSGIRPLADTEFSQDGQPFFIMGHDWRVEPFADWIDGVIERLVMRGEPASRERQAEIMRREEFDAAVRYMLEAMSKGEPLDRIELARSLMVQRARSMGPKQGAGEILFELVWRAIGELQEHKRGAHLVAVLHHTYIDPQPKQRAAAHEAGLAYGTYRRRLREATAALTDRLWQWERAASRPDSG